MSGLCGICARRGILYIACLGSGDLFTASLSIDANPSRLFRGGGGYDVGTVLICRDGGGRHALVKGERGETGGEDGGRVATYTRYFFRRCCLRRGEELLASEVNYRLPFLFLSPACLQLFILPTQMCRISNLGTKKKGAPPPLPSRLVRYHGMDACYSSMVSGSVVFWLCNGIPSCGGVPMLSPWRRY